MLRLRSVRGASGAIALAVAGSLTPLTLAQDEAAPPPSFNGPLLVVDHAGLDRFFVDAKDRPLAEALAQLPLRIRELPRELPDMPPEAAGIIELVLRTAASPARLAVTYNETPTGGAFGYGVALSVLTSGKESAERLHGRIAAMLAQADVRLPARPSRRFKGMTDIQTPAALLSYGPRQAKDGWRYEVLFGTVEAPDAAVEVLPAPAKGITPVLRARVDLGGLNPLFAMAESFAGRNPQMAEGISRLTAMGIGGDAPVRISYQLGHTDTESVSLTVVEGASRLGLETSTLAPADFAAIPSDATEVYLAKGGGNLAEWIDQLAAEAPPLADGLQQFSAMTGVDLRDDILASLGGTVALYLSDATGGGSLGSAVFMVSVKDRERLASAFNTLTGMANAMAEQALEGRGYVRIDHWNDATAGAEMISLRFPGVPVPFELTAALSNQWLVMAPTPQAALAAARQAAGKGDAGLGANKLFASSFRNDRKFTAITFSDAERNLRAGYPFISMIGSAIANAVRSPSGGEREPGLLVPTYHELRRGIRPVVSMTYWDGDNLITESHADRSVLVQAAGTIGMIGKIMPALVTLGAVAGAAERTQHRANFRVELWNHFERPDAGTAAIMTLAAGAIPELRIQHALVRTLGALPATAALPAAVR